MVLTMLHLCMCVVDILAETTASKRVVQYNNLVSKIEELGLDNVFSAKPLLNVCHSIFVRGVLMANTTSICRGRRFSPHWSRRRAHGCTM